MSDRTPTPIPNRTPEQIALAQRVRAQIEAHPQRWTQDAWRCETGMCFAGWAVELSGRQWAGPPTSRPGRSYVIALPDDEAHGCDVWGHQNDDGTVVSVTAAYAVAGWLLGLDFNEANALFYGGNDLADLRAYVEQIVAGEVIQDRYLDE
jgi:hypothetical protein